MIWSINFFQKGPSQKFAKPIKYVHCSYPLVGGWNSECPLTVCDILGSAHLVFLCSLGDMVRKREMFEVAVGLVKQYILAKVLTPKTPNDSWYVLLSSIGSLRDAPKTKCERTHYRRTDGRAGANWYSPPQQPIPWEVMQLVFNRSHRNSKLIMQFCPT